MILPLVLLAGVALLFRKGLHASRATASGAPGGASPLSTSGTGLVALAQQASSVLNQVLAPVDQVVNAVTGNTPAQSDIGTISTQSPNLTGAIPDGTVGLPKADPGPVINSPGTNANKIVSPGTVPPSGTDYGPTSGYQRSLGPGDYDEDGNLRGGRYQHP